jgi:predicted AAA+ superfamily ATPase
VSTTLRREIRRRHLLPRLTDALADTRVVLITGARQAGKSTLARMLLARVNGAVEYTLDDPATLAAARVDPTGFVTDRATIFIDEVQRAPELLLAIKAAVDRSPATARFLLTGSANVLSMARVADTLPGRMEVVELSPFSQGEVEGEVDTFIDRAFDGWTDRTGSSLTKGDYLDRAVRGGFPEIVLHRATERRRAAWFSSYIAAIVQREARDIAGVERPAELSRLLRLLAARSGQLLKIEEVARDADLPSTTARRFIRLMEAAYIVRTVPGWATSRTTRVVRMPKVFVCDSGLLCHVLGVNAEFLALPTSTMAGHVMETFVTMELWRQLGWSRTRADLFHFRTKDGTEVDAVLEAPDGRIVGVEVKARATVRSEDFRGLRLLADAAGDQLRAGLVLYTGTDTLAFGDRLRCLPLSALWEREGGQLEPTATAQPATSVDGPGTMLRSRHRMRSPGTEERRP